MIQKHNFVPVLDLAPKLKRPLSLLNPLDYLRLLYWVFFFPQALRCYVDKFGNKFIPKEELIWRKTWKWFRHNQIERQLILQGLALPLFIWLTLCVVLQSIGMQAPWSTVKHILVISCIVGLITRVIINKSYNFNQGLVLSVASSIVFNIGLVIVVFIWSGFFKGGISSITLNSLILIGNHSKNIIFNYISNGFVLGITFGLTLSVVVSVISGIRYDLKFFPLLGIILTFLITILTITVLFSFNKLGWLPTEVNWIFLTIVFMVSGIIFNIAFAMAILRLGNWAFYCFCILLSPLTKHLYLPHVTPIPLPNLTNRLIFWLRHDWEKGVHNAEQLLRYTLQFRPVVQAINQVLAELPSDQIISRLAQISDTISDPKLIRFVSEKLSIKTNYIFKPQLDTESRAVAAGFWYLYEQQPEKATLAFAKIRFILYGEEMFTLTQTIALLHEVDELATIALLQLPNPPTTDIVLYPTIWKLVESFRRVIKDVQVIQRSISISARVYAVKRARKELKNILYKSSELSRIEKVLLIEIAQTWETALSKFSNKLEQISIHEPVLNPYIVGNPVQGKLFVGREDILKELEELWILGEQLQSIVLYGHRRMGKTSILQNISSYLGSDIQVVYVNLQCLGDISQGVGEVLMAMTDEISNVINLRPPNDIELLTLPYRTFERYLKQINSTCKEGIIIALDEFEKIEELIAAGKIPKNFMDFLRGMVQKSPKIAFVFAGLHTLEEMTADYFQPFFASIIPIKVCFLTAAATHQLLTNPSKDFPLNYTPEALNKIYSLTAGQPYLVQLIGFQLVRLYNDQVFEQEIDRECILKVEDVEVVVNDPEFYQRGRYYFDGVWGQATQEIAGQHEIIKTIALHPQGISFNTLAQTTDLDETHLQDILNVLERHDVVTEKQGHWYITVELFRRWVLQQ